MSFVYVAESGDGYCKIGMSETPEARVKSIESVTGLSITRLHFERCEDKKLSEKTCHDKLANFRLFGEWFNIDFADAVSVLMDSTCESSKDKSGKQKPKQRGLAFTDDDWQMIAEAAKKQGYTTIASYVREVLIKKAKKDKR